MSTTFSAADFLAAYPKFGGTPTSFPGAIVFGSSETYNSGDYNQGPYSAGAAIAGVPASLASVLAVGQLITGPGIPGGTTITQIIGGATLTLALSNPVSLSGTFQFSAYTAPLVPLAVLDLHLSVAVANFDPCRWQNAWPQAVALYTAHFVTLWLKSDGGSYASPDQVAGAGLALTIQTAKSVGDVSSANTLLGGTENWGAWSLTVYGQQLTTLMRLYGAGGLQLLC